MTSIRMFKSRKTFLLTGVLAIFSNSCMRKETAYFFVDCDSSTDTHYFQVKEPEVFGVTEINILISSLEDDQLSEEEHSLVLDPQEPEPLWDLELNYDNTKEIAQPNQTTLYHCDTPRVVQFEVIYNNKTSVKTTEIVFTMPE